MEVIHVKSNPDFEANSLLKKMVKEADTPNLITQDCLIYVDGEPQILYKKLDFDFKPALWACRQINYKESERTGGMKSQSATFGFMPRRPLLGDYCRSSAMNYKNPKIGVIFEDLAAHLEKVYREHFPSVYEAHKQITEEKILPDWRMGNSIFSSGIANKDNPLPYHRDSGNFPNVFSNMIGLKNGIRGGHLVCPGIDLKFEIANQSLLIFNGQKILHGVSPFIKTLPDAYRYTVVYYTLQQMWKCLPLADEVQRIRATKTTREKKRLHDIRAKALSKNDLNKD